jgi:Ca2+/Na+ antiporter
MSFADRLILWLHIGVAIFTIGPVMAAIMSTPRYIRKRDVAVVGFLRRITRVYTMASLLVFVFGLVLAGLLDDFSKPWLSISMVLFVVAIVLLVLIIRDQGAAVTALRQETAALVSAPAAIKAAKSAEGDATDSTVATPDRAAAERIAAVERGRIASLGGVTALIWLVILVLMVWR